MFVYVGAAGSRSQGISVFRLDPASGALRHLQTVSELTGPSFLALHPHRDHLYAVCQQRVQDAPAGALAALAVDPADGTLRLLNWVPSMGNGPCYVSVHPGGRVAFAANYQSGHVAAFPLQEDGRLAPASDVVHHQGCGPHPQRQQAAHAHFITSDPGGTYVLSCDLGVDKVFVYRLDAQAGKLAANDVPYAQVASGEGPRHLAFHPNGRFAYVINELGSTFSAFAYDAARGTLTHRQTVSTIPEDFAERTTCAQVVVHPNGRFVYGSNRGHDSIAIFAIDQQTGQLTLVDYEPTRGKTPRNFNIDPTGTLLLAANQDSDTIVSFRIDPQTGRLTATGAVVETPAPVCVVFRAG